MGTSAKPVGFGLSRCHRTAGSSPRRAPVVGTLAGLALLMACLTASVGTAQQSVENGQMRSLDDGSAQAWHQPSQSWVSPQEFWRRYAEGRGGLTFGPSRDYPPYAEVKETDTFLVELDGGTCLMMFWHTRWRRANDVRRWDDGFNQVGSCPDVFK